MEALLLKLQNDVAARKRPRSDLLPFTRIGVLLLILFMAAFELGARSATGHGIWSAGRHHAALTAQIESHEGEIAIQRAHIERLQRAYDLSSQYGIGADLAIAIAEIADAEDVDPQLAFNLVRVESRFNPRAVSPVGALGLTQLMPETAELLSPGITRDEIFDQETNLRLGFRFFRYLLNYYQGDVRLALLAYNRGPSTVDRLLARGLDPGNGYSHAVLGGVALAD